MSEENKFVTKDLVPGVYSAIGKFVEPTIDFLKTHPTNKYMCALTIGWNPVYDNPEKTIEVYLMHDFGGPENEFYG
jgi:FAD synthase